MGELERRRTRERAVIGNALTKPVNVLVPAGLLVAGFLLSWLWVMVPLAIVAYVLLVVLTLFDEGEAKRVLSRGRADLGAVHQRLGVEVLHQQRDGVDREAEVGLVAEHHRDGGLGRGRRV